MSVRGVWVVTVGTEESPPRCLFARRYPTVERRAQLQSSQYTSLPADNELIISLLSVATQQHATFSETRDSCVGSHSSPVYWLGEGKLGPLVVIHSSDHLLAALGVDQQSVPCALSMLEAMAELITDPLDLTELRSFLSVCAPFGTPLDLRPSNAINRLTPVPAKVKPLSDLQKSPGWSVGVYRGPPKVTLCIREEIRSVQYDKTSIADTWDLSGTLISKVEVEGSPDIQVTLSTPHEWAGLEDIVYHPIVHADDAHHRGNQWKVRYSAPLESTSLLHYSVTALPCLPIRGFYQMKGDSSVRLLVQLKLNEGVKNYFEFCEVHIPFFNRGVIERLDSIVPSNLAASLALSKDNKSIVWAIGQRFPVRGLELSLQATVHFKEGPEENKPFFVGSNSYIEVFFKMPEFTLSGATVDSKSVTLFPSSKPKVVISRELYTSSYRVWNSHGDVLATYPQYRTQ